MFTTRTDLAAELRNEAMKNYAKENKGKLDGISERDRDCGNGISVCEIDITSEQGAKLIGKPMGKYVTVSFPTARDIDFKSLCGVSDVVSQELQAMCGSLEKPPESLMFCGLGNRLLSADAIGPMAADRVLVTRHVKNINPLLYDKSGLFDVCAVVPGVSAQTGIEAHVIIKSTADCEKPDLLIVADALAARETDRLARTVQLSSTGISPGSGIGGSHREISRESIGVPVIAIGVPTVVDTSTLIYDALLSGGCAGEPASELAKSASGLFVSPKEIDVISKNLACIIGYSINRTFQRGISYEEMMLL